MCVLEQDDHKKRYI